MSRQPIDLARRNVLKFVGGSLVTVATSGVASASTLDVVTNDASAIKDTSAYLNGDLLDMGGASEVSVWFEWGLEGTDLVHETTEETRTSTGIFSHQITNLEPGTTYEFRAVAYSSLDGRVEGGRRSFTTTGGSGWGGGGDDGDGEA